VVLGWEKEVEKGKKKDYKNNKHEKESSGKSTEDIIFI